jgi:hypothetical protein
MGARSPTRMWAVRRNGPAAGGARLHEGRVAWRAELVGGARAGEDGAPMEYTSSWLFFCLFGQIQDELDYPISFML